MCTELYLAISILLPIAAGLAVFAFKGRWLRRVYVTLMLSLSLAAAVMTFIGGDTRIELFSLGEKLPLLLVSDMPGRMFSLMCSVIWLFTGIFAFPYIEHEGSENRFFCFYMLCLGVLNALGYAGNLLTLYLFFECVTLLSFPLVLHDGSREAVNAALKYLFFSVAGAFAALFAVFYVSFRFGVCEFTPGGFVAAMGAQGDTGLLVASLMALLGFGVKAGMLPAHGWLPTAHPVAPAPASAVLSGVIAKAGVIAIFRFVFYAVGAPLIRGSWLQYTWMILALLTVFMGSMMAYREKLLKKRLAYSTVSQISYILLGLAMLNTDGLTGGVLQLLAHAIVKTVLFLSAGAIIYRTGCTEVRQLRGMGKRMPVTMWCWTIASLGLVGIPPTGGFVSKWYLALGSLGADIGVFRYIAPAVLLLSALLTACYLLSVSVNAFFPGDDKTELELRRREAPPAMRVSLVVLTALSLFVGLFPQTVIDLAAGFISLVV